MNKIILALALVLAPFFSSANIFEDGTVPMIVPQTTPTAIINCGVGNVNLGQSSVMSSDPSPLEMDQACLDNVVPYLETYVTHTQCGENATVTVSDKSSDTNIILDVKYRMKDWRGICVAGFYGSNTSGISSSLDSVSEAKECKDDELDYSSGEDLMCYRAIDATNNDSCSFNDVFSNPVTEQNACIVKNDASRCGVSAVDIGGGKSAYMPNENDCYSDVYPILDEDGGIGNLPDGSDQQCTESGALKYCPANPDEVCPNGQCDAGCGYMNDVMICVAPLDPPECTGDNCETTTPPEECTGDNCENTTPPEECTGDNCETGGGVVGGGDVIEPSRTKPSEGLEGFWESEYPDGVEGMFEGKIDELKETEFYLFLEEFNPPISSGSAPMYTLCFNFGPFGNYGCQEIAIDPRVFPALKVFILISAGFGCRRILFGG